MAESDSNSDALIPRGEHSDGHPSLDSVAKALIGEPQFTPLDIAARTNVSIEHLRRLWRALGFPPVPEDERAFTAADVEIVELLDRVNADAWLADAGVLQVARVLGQALARVAETEVGLVGSRLGPEGMLRAVGLMQTIEPFLSYVWRRHVLSALGRQLALDAQEQPAGRALVVGFADLVGFTALSHGLDGEGLARIVDRFEALAYEHIPEHRGRVIKMIGDEVMFVADEPSAAVEIALGLVESHTAAPEMPNIRVGLAFGTVVPWEGDLFGSTVNLASRLVQYAKPASVLISAELAAALGEAPGIRLKPLRRAVRLKGFDKVNISAVARATPDPRNDG